MNLKQWLANHTISAKTVTTGWVFVVVMWSTNDAFRGYAMGIYNALPSALHNFVAGVAIPALILWRTQKSTTATAVINPGQAGSAQAFAVVSKDGDPNKP